MDPVDDEIGKSGTTTQLAWSLQTTRQCPKAAQWCPILVRVIVTECWDGDVLSFKSVLSSIFLTHNRVSPKTPLGRWCHERGRHVCGVCSFLTYTGVAVAGLGGVRPNVNWERSGWNAYTH